MWNILDEVPESNEQAKRERVKQAKNTKKDKSYEPTWEEVWETGYTKPTGSFKKGLLKTNMQGNEEERLLKVKNAMEKELITIDKPLSKFSKRYALNKYSEVMELERDRVVKRMKDNKPDNYYCITSIETLRTIGRVLEDEDVIALDTETTGLTHEDVTVGMSLSLEKADIHLYIPYLHTPPERDEQIAKERVMRIMKPYLEREGLKIVGANLKFDVHMLEKDGLDLINNMYMDIQIAMHVLNENEQRYALKSLANKYGKYIGYEDDSKDFGELFGKDPLNFITADLEIASIYACKDTHLTLLFYQWIMKMFDKRPQLKDAFFNIEKDNQRVSTYMERNGMLIDLEEAERYKKELYRDITDIKSKINEELGEINLNSSQQIQKALYDDKGIEPLTKKRSTDKSTLEKLSKKGYKEADLILQYRDLNKVYSTYIEPLPKKVRDTGRLHGRFNQTGTVTGRYSSNDPNLQNIPESARGIFIAPKGKVIIGIDYSQIEPRTLAHISGDTELQRPYKEDIDFYAFLGSKVFELPYEACLEEDDTTWRKETNLKKHPRKMMKVGMLAVMYGISNYGLSNSLGITEKEAEEFIEDFYIMFPRTKEWMQEIHQQVFKDKYISTMFGRKRRFPDAHEVLNQQKVNNKKVKNILGYVPDNIWDEKLPFKFKYSYNQNNGRYEQIKRMSVNAVIQGTASEVLKKAMYEAYKYISKKEGWKMIATIHDEVLYEIPDDATPEEIKGLEDAMKGVVNFDVPIQVDTEVMEKWSTKVSLEDWINAGRGRHIFKEAK